MFTKIYSHAILHRVIALIEHEPHTESLADLRINGIDTDIKTCPMHISHLASC